MNRPLSGQSALVTGASSGIGAATAIALARAGADLLIHYHSKESDAAEVARRARTFDVHVETVSANLATSEGIQDLVSKLANVKIDILVNNAGSLVARTRVLDMTEDLWDEVMTLNLKSAFFLSKAAIPGMVARGGGVIVNISTVAARFGGGVGALAYSSAKAAVSTMTKGLTKEFASSGIRVNSVSPGTVDTNYHRSFSTPEALQSVKAATPTGQLGSPEEIADVVVFLCTEESRFIHGQVIEVNGGFFMG